MIIKRIMAGPLGANCYVIGCEETKEGAIIDPGGRDKEIIDQVEKEGLEIKWVINTHAHSDHIAGNEYVLDHTGAKLVIHEDDEKFLMSPNLNLSSFTGDHIEGPEPDRKVVDGDVIEFGNISLKVLHTPGHSPGCICLLKDDVLFSGDTIFREGIGRPDLPGGNQNTLLNSIKTVLDKLDDDTVIYPGHGEATSVKHEKKNNPFLML
ncbi:MBL fold metallo-hydrolase [Natranaerofaba carboxydovora]|uniref:MBL fold metallo-hydrolase n=1 Tax=Natranaerofaba carboxydovora TaxID=2742683 RepID=UPI001F13D1C5|nr:MBL fold metallo-hydrolase [Natranaerofaba carboxydovora]UMZ73245.1 Hydroxyacylglutathione hydrolase GloC [Natranaerofaba carboxydovora]